MSSTLSEFRQNSDSAISPVIAVILMVAITVVIIAITGVVVLSMTDSSTISGKVVGVSGEAYATETDHGVIAKFWGGKDFSDLVSVRAYIGDLQLALGDSSSMEITNPMIGKGYYFSTYSTLSKPETIGCVTVQTTEMIDIDALGTNSVTFIGKFSDGTEQVIYMWEMFVPGVNTPPGIYYKNEFVKVIGYNNTDGWLGHGLRIEILQPTRVKLDGMGIDTVITACDMKDSKGASYSDPEKLFASTVQKYSNTEYKNIYLLPTRGGTVDSPFESSGEADKLTGWVMIKVNVDGKPQEYKITVDIPARQNYLDVPKYSGTASLSGGNILINLGNGYPDNNNNKYNAMAYFRSDDGSVTNIGALTVSSDRKTITWTNPDLDKYSSGTIEIYALGGQHNSKWGISAGTVWYPVWKGTAAELQSP